jgi:excisionase family DNA binding protein
MRVELDPRDLDELAELLAPRVAELIATSSTSAPARTVYTPATLAAELGVTARAIRAAIERGELRARRSGRGWVIAAAAVAEWARPTSSSSPRTRASTRRRSAPLREALAGMDHG